MNTSQNAMLAAMMQKEQASAGKAAPLKADQYIMKIIDVEIGTRPKWGTTDPQTDRQICYRVRFSPYQTKSLDPEIVDTSNEEVPALSRSLLKTLSTATGVNKEGAPAHTRALIMYCGGQPDLTNDEPVVPSKYIVMTKDDLIASEKSSELFLKQALEVHQGKLGEKDFTMRNEGYYMIPDLRDYVGEYVSANVIVKVPEKGNSGPQNVITGFSRLPNSFKADPAIETKADEVFKERLEKYKARELSDYSVWPSEIEGADVEEVPEVSLDNPQVEF